jgi:hypothetical protein
MRTFFYKTHRIHFGAFLNLVGPEIIGLVKNKREIILFYDHLKIAWV